MKPSLIKSNHVKSTAIYILSFSCCLHVVPSSTLQLKMVKNIYSGGGTHKVRP